MRAAVLVALVQRDLRLVLRSRGVLVPLAVVPLVTLVLIPAVVAFLPAAAGAPEQLVNALPLQLTPADVVQAQVANLSPEESFLTLALLHFMAPVYLLVPLIVASVIAVIRLFPQPVLDVEAFGGGVVETTAKQMLR